jgi:hypothetical protein
MPNDLAIIRQDLVMLSPFEATIGSGNKGQPGFDSTLWPWDGPPLWEGSRASNKSIVQGTNSGQQTAVSKQWSANKQRSANYGHSTDKQAFSKDENTQMNRTGILTDLLQRL